jgi:hypothetical protein
MEVQDQPGRKFKILSAKTSLKKRGRGLRVWLKW